jgi:hypothetical protein
VLEEAILAQHPRGGTMSIRTILHTPRRTATVLAVAPLVVLTSAVFVASPAVAANAATAPYIQKLADPNVSGACTATSAVPDVSESDSLIDMLQRKVNELGARNYGVNLTIVDGPDGPEGIVGIGN